MIRPLILSALALSLAACSTTSTVHQRHAPATAGQVYAYSFENQGGDDAEGIARLDGVIQDRLRQAGLLGGAGAGQEIEVTLRHYYLRSDAGRFWAGIMAGRDKITSDVRIVGADGTQRGSFQVETTNSTAWGSSDGLMQKHADEIVARMR